MNILQLYFWLTHSKIGNKILLCHKQVHKLLVHMIEKYTFSWFRQEYFNSSQGACGTLAYFRLDAYFILSTFIDFACEAAPHNGKLHTGWDINIYI